LGSKVHRKRKKIPIVSRLGKAEDRISEFGFRIADWGRQRTEFRISDCGLGEAEGSKEISQFREMGDWKIRELEKLKNS
jgi:hypothetical protein